MKSAAIAAVLTLTASLAVVAPTEGVADAFRTVGDKSEFIQLVNGRTLNYPGVTLQVTPDGRIEGRGLGRPVTGQWQWQGGYFCRDLYWGQRELGANCQLVMANGGTLRFVSDRGAGQSADLRLR